MRCILVVTLLAGCSSANFDVVEGVSREDASSDSVNASESFDGEIESAISDGGTDTFVAPADTYVAPADTHVAPDTYVAPTDTGTPPIDGGAPDLGSDAEGPVACPAFAYDPFTHTWPLACVGSSGACFEGFSCGCAQPLGRQDAKGSYSWTAASFGPSPSSFSGAIGDCPKSGPDHAYKLFLRKGETVTAALSVYTTSFGTYLTTFWESRSCMSNVCSGSFGSCGSTTSTTTPSIPTTSTYKATSDGWITVVVSGKTPSDKGFYNLKLTLSGCSDSLCGCG